MVLRNSFMFLNKKVSDKIKSLGFSSLDMFKPEPQLVKMLVERETDVKLHLGEESSEIKAVYNKLTTVASDVDPTLKQHVEALSVKALHRLELLEKKMLSAEKKKFEAQLRHIKKLKLILFPGETLQERVDNFLPYYALWGPAFIDAVYKYSTGLKQEFCVIEELK